MGSVSLRIVAEFVLVVVAQLANLLGSLATLKVLTAILPVPQFGLFALGLTVAQTILAVAFDPLGKTILRFSRIAPAKPLGLQRLTHGFQAQIVEMIRRTMLALLCVVIVVTLLIGAFWDPSFMLVLVVAAVLGYAHGFFQSALMLCNAFRFRGLAATSQILVAVARPVLAAGLAILMGSNAIGAMAGIGLAYALVALASLRISFGAIDTSDDAPSELPADSHPIDSMGVYNRALVLTGAIAIVSLYSDRWILAGTMDLASVGVYSAIVLLASGPLTAINGVIYRFIAPIAFGNKSKDTRLDSRRTGQLVLLLWAISFVPMLAVVVAAHHSIVSTVTGRTYATFSDLLPIVLIGMGLERAGHLLSVVGQYLYETRPYILTRVLHAVCLTGASILLLPSQGLYALAYAHVFAGAVFLLAVLRCNASMFKEAVTN